MISSLIFCARKGWKHALSPAPSSATVECAAIFHANADSPINSYAAVRVDSLLSIGVRRSVDSAQVDAKKRGSTGPPRVDPLIPQLKARLRGWDNKPRKMKTRRSSPPVEVLASIRVRYPRLKSVRRFNPMTEFAAFALLCGAGAQALSGRRQNSRQHRSLLRLVGGTFLGAGNRRRLQVSA